jgi:hypothetical protein
VGQCARHYYNKSDTYWGIAMFYAGTCEASGMAPEEHPVCIFPPHSTGTLHYANFGDVADGDQIAITGQDYRQNFDLLTVGCYIEHHGRTGNATLNDPADGDIVTVGL